MRITPRFIACHLLPALIAGAPLTASAITIGGRSFRDDGNTRRPAYDLTWTVKESAATPCAFAWGLRDDRGTVLEITGGTWNLKRLNGTGVDSVTNGELPHPHDAIRSLTIKRRQRFLSGYMNDGLLFRISNDDAGNGGYASWSGVAGAVADDAWLQAVSGKDMRFEDDFMRLPDSPTSIWDTVAGNWHIQSAIDKTNIDAVDPNHSTRSANPFVFRGTGAPEAMVMAGHEFWDDLAVSGSVRSQGGRGGLVFGARAANDYFVLLWESNASWMAPCRFAIERVRPDGRTVLAETYCQGQRQQWYRIGVEQHGARIIATLQGTPILDAVDRSCTGGRFGMYAADGAVDFDDIDVRPAPLRPLLEQSGGSRFAIAGPAPARVALTVTADGGSDIVLNFGTEHGGRLTFRWPPGAPGARRTLTSVGAATGTVVSADGGYQRHTPIRLIIENEYGAVIVRDLQAGLLLRQPGLSIPAGGIEVGSSENGSVKFSGLVIDGPDERKFERPIKNDVFAADSYMHQWATPTGQWVRHSANQTAPALLWHKSDCYGPVALRLPAAACRDAGGARVWLGGLSASFKPLVDKLSVRLAYLGKELAANDVAIPKDGETISFHRDGNHVWIRSGNEDWLATQLTAYQAGGSRLGLQLPDEAMLQQVNLRRGNVLDYQFDRVPTDWHKLGRWEISNKFDCDSRWSYMVGESDALAALWHRDSFTGDLTLEFYAGMRYYGGGVVGYTRPGDINAVLGTGDRDVFDGYTFVISGWGTSRTCILRNGEIVAVSDAVIWPSTKLRQPSTLDLHRRWVYVKIRRRGSQLELYADNQLILEWNDRQPLDVRRLGLWTVDNGIVIARTKISYTQRHRFRPETEAEVKPPPARAIAERPGLSLSSPTHPGCRFSFDQPGAIHPWQRTGSETDTRISYSADGVEGGSLRATNPVSGGAFDLHVPITPLDIRRAAELSFAIRMETSVKIDLHARIDGRHYVLRMTGPVDEQQRLKTLGHLPAPADGQWHTVSFPLGDILAAERPNDTSLKLESLYFGVRGGYYLRAGYGGNPAGAVFDIDNFEIWSSGDRRIEVLPKVDDGKRTVKGRFSISREDGGEVCRDQPFEGSVQYELPEAGKYALTVIDDATGAPHDLRFAACDDLQVTQIEPDENAAWGGTPLRVHFNRSLGVPLWALQVKVGERTWKPGTPELQWDPGTGVLSFDPAAALRGTSYAAGDGVVAELALTAPELKQLCRWRLSFDPKLDKTPPSPVRIAEVPVRDTFEYGLDNWSSFGNGGAQLFRDPTQAAAGGYSLKLVTPALGRASGAHHEIKPFSAGRFPVVSFDMRMTEPVRTDLLLRAGGTTYRIGLTDSDWLNDAAVLTRLATPEPDGKWRHYEVDFARLLYGHEYHKNHFTVDALRFQDFGWRSNSAGAPIWIDNFSLIPSSSSTGDGFELNWAADDLSGIGGYSWHWSSDADADADKTPATSAGSSRFTNLREGRRYFHIRAFDNAGNWGPTSSYPFVIDNTPPRIGKVSPPPDSRTGETRFTVQISDNHSGFDPETIEFTVNGRTCHPGDTGVDLDLATGTCTVDWFATGHWPTERPASHALAVRLSAVNDLVGNHGRPMEWSFTFDRQLDRKPPLAPTVEWVDADLACRYTFEPGQPAMDGRQVYDETLGTYVSRSTAQKEGHSASITIFKDVVDIAKHPYLTFRYRFPPQAKLDLLAHVLDPNRIRENMVIKLTDAFVYPDKNVIAGTLEDFALDNEWHAVAIDFRPYIMNCVKPGTGAAKNGNDNSSPVSNWAIKHLKFADAGENWPPIETAYYFDDVQLQAPGPPKAQFRFAADDAAGVSGFAWSMDRDPNTSPPPRINAAANATVDIAFPENGLWYVHARAIDGNGNWSQPGHFAYIVEGIE